MLVRELIMKIPSEYKILSETVENRKIIHLQNEVSEVCLYIYEDDPGTVYIANLYVDTNVRNKGIGTLIMQICESIAIQLKASKQILFVQKNSWMQKWYSRLGYKRIKDFNILPPLNNTVWMEKEI